MTKVRNRKSVIGKEISSVPNKHKAYFEVDDNNIISSYKRKICIDRVHLKTRIEQQELEELTERYKFRVVTEKQPNGFVRTYYVFDLIEPFGVYLKVQLYVKSKSNVEIQLQSKFTNNLNGNNPHILAILNRFKWFITRLDIAIDYTTPFNNSAYLRRNGNQKQQNYDTSSWAGSMSNPNRKANDSHYDRKAKNETLDTKFTNRFEVKLNFNESDCMTFANMNHSEIAKRLRAELFIPCLTYSNFYKKKVKTNRGEKDYVELIKRSKEGDNENYVKLLLNSQGRYQTFRNNFKACRDEIENLYLENSHIIYDFLLGKN